MSRIVKIVKDKEGIDIEVYSDNCINCNQEMIFPKNEADKIESLFPFIKEKVEKGTECLGCAQNKLKTENKFDIFSKEELEHLEKVLADYEHKR